MKQKIKIGPLECTVVGPYSKDSKPEVVVLLCHGFGAGGDDLVPIAEEILGASEASQGKVTFIMPAAPLALDSFGGFDGRAWWMINMQKLAEMTGTNDFKELRTAVPPGIIEAREMLKETLAEIFSLTGCGWNQLIIGGFSQGAMLTAETVLNAEENPLALIQWSGTLVCEEQWKEKVTTHSGLRVLQSHGTIDPVLPFSGAEWLHDLFANNGCDVDFLEFHGVHTIPMDALKSLMNLLEETVG